MGCILNEMLTEQIKELCLKYMVVELKNKMTRIHPMFLPIFNSTWKRHSSIMDSLAISLRSYCPEASVLELSVMCTVLSAMMARRSEKIAKLVHEEIMNPVCQKRGTDKLRSLGIRNNEDVSKVLKEEDSMK